MFGRRKEEVSKERDGRHHRRRRKGLGSTEKKRRGRSGRLEKKMQQIKMNQQIKCQAMARRERNREQLV